MIKILNVNSLYSALYKAVDFCKENANKEIEIVVPDKLSLFMEKFLFEHMNITASFNIKVSTLNRFAKKTCFVEKDKQISKVGSLILIHKILNEHINDLKVLKSKAYSFSYAEDIFKTIGQLKASKIGFEEMKNFNSKDEQLTGKIADLALVYEEYENGKAGLLDASDLFLMSTFYIANGKENKKILFVGFDDFTAIEYAIIERLATVAEVNILNYKGDKTNKYIFNDEIISQLKNIAYDQQLDFKVEDCKVETNDLKRFLEENLYALENNDFLLTKELVKVFAGNNVKEEIEFVARDIRNKILNGQKYKDFGVAVFDLSIRETEIKEIFSKYEINYYVDTEMLLSRSTLYKFYVSVLKYNLDGFSLTSIIDLINSPFFMLEEDKKRQIIKKLTSVKFRGKIDNNLNLDLEEELKTELIKFFSNIIFDKRLVIDDLIKNLKQIDVDNVLNLISTNNLESKILINKSKEVIFTLFDEILKFNKDINIDAFFDIFKHISSVVKINNLPLKLDAVKIVDANNSMEVFDDLYVVGANNDKAPTLKHDCGIILDGEIEKLNFSHKLSPTISHINKLARLRLFNLLLLFENELVVTYSNNASDMVKELLEKLKINTKKGIKNIVPITNFGYEKYVALSQYDYIDYLCKYQKNNLFNNKNVKNNENLIKNKEFLNISNNNLKIYDDFNVVSATTLENYFKCPFYAFLNNILKINPEMEIEILSLDIGNILHEIMCNYYKVKKQVDDVYEFCKTQVFNLVEKEERLKLNVDSPILVNLIDEAVRIVNAMNYIDENSQFVPKFFEYDFRGDKALKLKNISIVGKVDRVDECGDMLRVIDYKSGKADASLKELYYGNKLQLFLYASAMEILLNKKVVGSFYLPLHNAYTNELGNTYSLKGFYIAEDFVVKAMDKRIYDIKKSDIVNVSLTKTDLIRKTIGYKELESNQFDMLKNYAKEVGENAVDEIKSGFIKPTPSEVSKPCQYCPYVHICFKESNSIGYRNSSRINLDCFREVNND